MTTTTTTTTTATAIQYRTITMTGRPPVRIREDHWPVIAHAAWGDNAAIPCQSNTRAAVRVRRHADGRAIVYGHWESDWQGSVTVRSGVLLAAGDDICGAIRAVGDEIECAESLIAATIAALPPEEI